MCSLHAVMHDPGKEPRQRTLEYLPHSPVTIDRSVLWGIPKVLQKGGEFLLWKAGEELFKQPPCSNTE